MILSPPLLDLVLAGVAGELLLIAAFLRSQRAAAWIVPLFWFLASGACLMIALRAALDGPGGLDPALPLSASLFTHIAMLVSVWGLIKKARS